MADKIVTIHFDTRNSWEAWSFSVPEEASEEWIRENISELWTNGAAICQEEYGNDGMTISEIEMPPLEEDEQERLI